MKKVKEHDPLLMGERIRRRREELQLTREQMAELVGVSTKFLRDVEYGSKGISLKKFTRLIQVLDASADYLLLGDISSKGQLICEVKWYIK